MSFQFKAHVLLSGQIYCLSGLHIGGSEEIYDIGREEDPLLKDPIGGLPYIPGSSLKGKMRSALEWVLGLVEQGGEAHNCDRADCPVCRIFGTSAEQHSPEPQPAGPTRLFVRDAHLSQETLRDPRYVKHRIFLPEIKTETSLNRITSATTPRRMERVPRGARFDFEMLYGVYDLDHDEGEGDIANLQQLAIALQLLEAGALGGGGSRGSGRIRLERPAAQIKRLADYQRQAAGEPDAGARIEEAASFGELIVRVQQELQTL